MSEQEYTIEKCGGLTVYHPVGSQYPDLKQQADRTERWVTIADLIEVERKQTERNERRAAYYRDLLDAAA